eukprot:TRINITY_DN5308_c0_g1_i2.p1 TRINITY_DN5308_c0_g1~~TRINITY_DN5308_c0_g1_i2.p1  ORF type:complete len:187 (+),score=34.86 TRINITY_DN5308_c0_g1_i2:75-635(+)
MAEHYTPFVFPPRDIATRPPTAMEDIIGHLGFLPTDPVAYLYAARAYYKMKWWHFAIECLQKCLNAPQTKQEAYHLLGFSLMKSEQYGPAITAFLKSIRLGNEIDFQPYIELILEFPDVEYEKPDDAEFPPGPSTDFIDFEEPGFFMGIDLKKAMKERGEGVSLVKNQQKKNAAEMLRQHGFDVPE